MNVPFIKGWVPFKGLSEECKEKKKNGKKDKDENQEDKVDIPKDWKPESFKLEDNPHKRLFASSEFKVLYPKALDKYFKEVFPLVQKALQEHYIKAEWNQLDGELIVKTTPKTFDPFILIKAHSVIRVLARFVPVEESLTLLEEDVYEDIIPIGHRKQDTFIKRTSRIKNDEMVELIREVLGCKIFVSGKSVAVIGPHVSLLKVRKVVEDCFFKNVHPIYHMKRFQIMNKLALMPEMANQSWDNLLPPIPKKKTVARKVPHKVREKGEYTPFPPQQPETKRDQELASGVFHLKYKKNSSGHYKVESKKRKIAKDEEE